MAIANITQQEDTSRQQPHSGYLIQEMTLDTIPDDLLEPWRQSNNRFCDHTMHCDPDWLQVHFQNQKKNVHVYFCKKDGAIVGAVPFHLANEPMRCQIGDLVLAKLPMRVMRLQGYTPNIPAEESAYDALFREILKTPFDAIFMNYVRTDSFLWNYLHSSSFVQKSFRYFSKRGPEPHLLARLDGSFESYMQKFSAKTRKNRLREIKKLTDRGDMKFIRVSEESEVDAYLEATLEISRKTWQFRRLGWGIAASDPDVMHSELNFLAQRGWLRSYLLKCGDAPCSFIGGWQYGPRFYHAIIGFDPAWSNFSVGSVLQLLVLEDLFKENTPQIYDFGTFAEYKQYFSTESYSEDIVWLFRRRPYPLFVNGMQRVFNRISRKSGALLNRFGLKAKIKQLLRAMPGKS